MAEVDDDGQLAFGGDGEHGTKAGIVDVERPDRAVQLEHPQPEPVDGVDNECGGRIVSRVHRRAADDLHGQTAAAMRNLKTAMDAAGVGWDDIVRRTIYTTQPTEYETITKAIDEVTGSADHPAQTIVGITGLAVPGCLIEIECTAVCS